MKRVIGEDAMVEVINYDKGADSTDVKLFNSLAAALKAKDPEAVPVPFVLSAVTDGRFVSRAGIQTYGFTPMQLPVDYDFISMAHNVDERIPLEAIPFGIQVLTDYIVNRYKEVFNDGKQ